MTHSDLIVIGGGVIGLSIAWEASQHGLSVTLLEDRAEVGRGCSWAAAGILPATNLKTATDPLERLRGLSHQLHPQWARKLRELTGIDTGLRRCGGLYVATTPGEAAALVGLQDYWKSDAIECRRLFPAELASVEPALQPMIQSQRLRLALQVPDEHQLRCPSHLKALEFVCRQAGVRVETSATARSFAESSRQVTVVTEHDTFHGGAMVLTAGSWSTLIGQQCGVSLQVVPVRGQMLLYRLPSPLFRHVINEGNRYFVAREDGHLLIGSCEEEVGFQEQTTTAALERFRHWAIGYYPALGALQPIKSWAGLRPGTVDGFPYIGRIPGRQNCFVATGHYRSGIHLSCGTAVVILDLITGQKPRIACDEFRVGRG